MAHLYDGGNLVYMHDRQITEAPQDNRPYILTPPRQEVFGRLWRLVGAPSAEIYRDICRIVDSDQPLASSTHLINHLFRELESSLTDVLKNLVEELPRTYTYLEQLKMSFRRLKKGIDYIVSGELPEKPKTDHAVKVNNVLIALGIPLDSETAKLWRKPELHRFTHRRGLGLHDFDQSAKDRWSGLEKILSHVLQQFETKYGSVFNNLEALAKKDSPNRNDATFFLGTIPNNYTAHDRFFRNARSPLWLVMLRARGYFSKVPPVTTANGFNHQPWPAAQYLERMATISPQQVVPILLEVENLENGRVVGALLSIAEKLPQRYRASLIDKVKIWISASNHYFAISRARSLIRTLLAERCFDEALTLSRIFLETHSDKSGDGQAFGLDDSELLEFLHEDLRPLLSARSGEVLHLALDQLESFVKREGAEEGDFKDALHISRPAIEDHAQNKSHRDKENALISFARDAGREMINQSSDTLKQIVETIEARRWTIFRRIALCLLADFPESDPELVAEYLTQRNLFDDYELWHEYARLLNVAFKKLPVEKQELILNWINQADSVTALVAGSGVRGESVQTIIDTWRLEHLACIGDQLPEPAKSTYDELVARFGTPEYPDFHSYIRYGSSYQGSFLNATEMSSMSTEEIVAALQKWEPKEEDSFLGPSRSTTGQQLVEAMKMKPEKFINASPLFIGLDPTYVRSYLQGIEELIRLNKVESKKIDWAQIVSLAEWMLEQPRIIPERKGEYFDQDPDWSWSFKRLASLLQLALGQYAVPYHLKSQIWSILESLLKEEISVEPADGAPYLYEKAYTDALNSVRGETIGAVINFGFWVKKNDDTLKGFPDEVREVLGTYLSEDHSPATRSVYGRDFPWLLSADEEWARANAEAIFFPSKANDELHEAAWCALLLYTGSDRKTFAVLKERFALELGSIRSLKRSAQMRQRYIEYMMDMYALGEIELDDKLFQAFWELADKDSRGYAVDYIGRRVNNEKNPPSAEIIDRLKSLWEQRGQQHPSLGPEEAAPEYSAFAWWFASGNFDDDWIIPLYKQSVSEDESSSATYHVLERLVVLAAGRPLDTAEILERIIQVNKKVGSLALNSHRIREVLVVLLKSSDGAAKSRAEAMVNRLVSFGLDEYCDLLDTQKPNDS